MALIWSKLKPQDRYQIITKIEPSLFEIKLLGQLYQPLMGHTAYSLYLTLLSEVEGDSQISATRNHQWLMNIMNISLDQLYQARLRLEALGLLKTFIVKTEMEYLEYHLLSPLTVEQFFQEDILSICLYNQVGVHRYRELRARYSVAKEGLSEEKNKKELTHEFHEVFNSFHPSELVLKEGTEQEAEMNLINQQFPLAASKVQHTENIPQFERFELDIEALKGFFMKGINADKLLTPKNLREIKKVAFFYKFDLWSLSRVIQDSLTLEDELELALFREKAKEWYRVQQGGQPPQITHLTQPIGQRLFHNQEQLNEEEKHLAKLETISPVELLAAYQGGGRIADADLKLVEELIFDYQLYPAVVNLLLEYVLLTNEYKLPRNLVTKVAAHWKRLKITDIREAQALARKEHQQYKDWKEQKKNEQAGVASSTKRAPRKVANDRRDILPEWIANPKYEASDSSNTSLTDQQKRERAEQLLKSLGEWRENGGE